MKNILVTTRTICDLKYNENYFSISHDWINLFKKINIFPILVNQNLTVNKKFLEKNNIQGLILTNGEDVNLKINKNNFIGNKRDLFEIKLINLFLKNKLPILGVCRGHQLINNYFGGNLIKKKGHAGTKHRVNLLKSYIKDYLKTNTIFVNSYHNFVIENKNSPRTLNIWAKSNNTIEGFYHKKFKILTLMWHPERGIKNNFKSIRLITKHFKIKNVKK